MADKNPKWDETIEEPTFEETMDADEISALEAARLGVTEGATFGLDVPVAGAAAALGEAAGRPDLSEQEQKLLELQKQFEESKARRAARGEEVPELAEVKPEDYEQKLLDTYYEGKKGQKELKEKAAKDQPLSYYTSLVGGSVGGLGATTKLAAKLGKAGKLLPSITKTKDLSGAARIGKAATEGAKAGTITSLTGGEAELLKGDVAGTAKETAESAIGGAILAGGLQIGGEAIKKGGKVIKESKLVGELSEAFKKGTRGITTRTEEAFIRELGRARNAAKEIRDKIVGLRKETGGDIEAIRSAQTSGIQLSESIERFVQKLDNVPDITQNSLREKSKILKHINNINADLTDMGAKDAGKVVTHIKSLTDLVEGKSPLKDKELQALVREFSKEATESVKSQVKDTDFIRLNKMYSKLKSLESAGKFKERFDPVKIEKEIDRFTNILTRAENPVKAQAAYMDLDRFLTRLKDVSPEVHSKMAPKLKDIQKTIEVVRETVDLPKFSEGFLPAIFGRGKSISLRAANIAGEGAKGTKGFTQTFSKGLRKIIKKSTSENIRSTVVKIQESGSEAAKKYIQPLLRAAEGTDANKNAIMYGLYQQAAFRKILKDIGWNLDEEE